ncbi:MAG: trypsin-like peptidase domain-containing protein [Magnetococcales bacterium]|nr:trypsin-like peptidase domain-containing protein [Magnetococcales bacterium]
MFTSINRFVLIAIYPFCIWFIFGCTKIPFGQSPEPIRKAEDGYISVKIWTPWLVQITGSAVIINDGVAVTNRHIMESVFKSKGTLANDKTVALKNVVLLDTLDIAVFDIPCGVGTPIRWNKNRHIKQGQNIYALGTSKNNPVFKGVVVKEFFKLHHSDIDIPKATKNPNNKRSITNGFIYKGETSHGFSGGPVLDVKGELIGINQGRIKKFLSKDPQANKISTSETFGFAYHIRDVIAAVTKYTPIKMQRCQL